MAKKSTADMNTTVDAELPLDVAALAQKSVGQAQVAFEKAGDFAKQNVEVATAAAEVYKSHFENLQAKTIAATKSNMTAAFDFAHQVFGMKDVSALVALQQDFFKAQTAAFQTQAKEISEIAAVMAKEVVKPVQDNLSQSVAQFNKAFAA